MMTRNQLDYCPHCPGDRTVARHDRHCFDYHDVGSANVRHARLPDEVAALDQRYGEAVEEAGQRNIDSVRQDFEQRVETDSVPVVNMPVNGAGHFLVGGKLYKNYYEQIRDGDRPRAALKNDQHRLGVDGWVFPGYGEEVRHAVLSLDGHGATGYGPLSFVIANDDGLYEGYTSALSRNSYDFYDDSMATHYEASRSGPPTLPQGHRSDWQNRHRLAVAKLAEQLRAETTAQDYAGLLVQASHNRQDEEFIELHICRPFGRDAITDIHFKRGAVLNPHERGTLAILRDRAEKQAIRWHDYD